MQISMSKQGLRVVGKAWQVQAQLRAWAEHPLTVAEFLSRQQPEKKKI
jgi:hypothetical protein